MITSKINLIIISLFLLSFFAFANSSVNSLLGRMKGKFHVISPSSKVCGDHPVEVVVGDSEGIESFVIVDRVLGVDMFSIPVGGLVATDDSVTFKKYNAHARLSESDKKLEFLFEWEGRVTCRFERD
jgi:hypothetical protein